MTTIDATSLLAEIEGTTTLAVAEAELRAHGLTLDVGSLAMTLAEWIARGAPGARDAWLDPADHLVAGFDATLKNGTTIRMRPAPRRAVGPDLLALFFGTEGRYGTVTRAWIRVHKIGVPRPTSAPFASARNPPVGAGEEALLAALDRALGHA